MPSPFAFFQFYSPYMVYFATLVKTILTVIVFFLPVINCYTFFLSTQKKIIELSTYGIFLILIKINVTLSLKSLSLFTYSKSTKTWQFSNVPIKIPFSVLSSHFSSKISFVTMAYLQVENSISSNIIDRDASTRKSNLVEIT